jgi:phosphotransferase system enzyme I (PtsI)
MNSAMQGYYQSYHPGVFKLINETVRAFEKHGKPVSICGELAADPLAAPALIGLGVRKLSMGAGSIAKIKKTIASLNIKKCEETAAVILELSTAQEIKDYLTA